MTSATNSVALGQKQQVADQSGYSAIVAAQAARDHFTTATTLLPALKILLLQEDIVMWLWPAAAALDKDIALEDKLSVA